MPDAAEHTGLADNQGALVPEVTHKITVDYADANSIGRLPNGAAIIHHHDGTLLQEVERRDGIVTCTPLASQATREQ